MLGAFGRPGGIAFHAPEGGPSPHRLVAYAEPGQDQRPIEARVSGFPHAPWGQTRGSGQTPTDYVRHEEAAGLLRRAVIAEPNAKSHHGLGEALGAVVQKTKQGAREAADP